MGKIATLFKRIAGLIEFHRDPVSYFRSTGVQIGEGTVLYNPNRRMFSTEPYLVKIGRDCHITPDVFFVPHDGTALLFRKEEPTLDLLAPITIGDRRSSIYRHAFHGSPRRNGWQRQHHRGGFAREPRRPFGHCRRRRPRKAYWHR
jgi:hypothetical protein